MIYTSYFAKMKKYPNMEFFSIARFTPRGIHIPTIQDLVPEENLIREFKAGRITEDEYRRIYFQQLATINRLKLGNFLQEECIVCYEKTGAFCHRHLVAEWLQSVGFDVKELE